MERVQEDLAQVEDDLKEVRAELVSTAEKQARNPKAEVAAELVKTRAEIETTISVLLESKQQLEKRRQSILSRLDVRKPCPICGGKLTKIENVARKNHHKNRDVWPAVREGFILMCGDDNYVERSPVCTRCWAAQSITSGIWTQQSQNVNAFVVPLAPGIAQIPPPPTKAPEVKWTFRRLQFGDGKRHEDAWLVWQDAPRGYLAALEQHAEAHGLVFKDALPGSLFRDITLSTREEEDHIPGL